MCRGKQEKKFAFIVVIVVDTVISAVRFIRILSHVVLYEQFFL